MSSFRRIASSSVLRAMDTVVQVLTAFWITPLLVHTLGRDRYGLWVTVIAFVSYIDIFDLGLTSAVTRYVSRALGRKNMDEAHDIVRSAFTILLYIGLACMLVVVIMAAVAPVLLKGSAQTGPVRGVILILGFTAAASFPTRVFAGVLEAFIRFECTTATSIARTILTALAMWWVLKSGGGMIAVITVMATGGLLQRTMNYLFARQVLHGMKLLPLGTTPGARQALLSYGWRNFVMKLVDLVRFRIDNLVIARFVSVGSVGPYSVGMSLINYFRQLIESLGGVLMPVFSHSEGMGERKLLQEQLVVAIKLSATLSVFAGGSLLLYGGFFIERWLGAGFGDSYKVMLILAPAFILALAQNPGIYLLFGISRQGRLIRLNTIEAVLNFAFSIGLVWKFGVFGVAAGTAISLFVSKIILQPWILCEETGLPLSRYWIDALLLPILKTSLPMLVVYRVILPWLRPDYGVLMLTVLVQAAVVLPVAWLLLFGKSERERIARVFSRRTDG